MTGASTFIIVSQQLIIEDNSTIFIEPRQTVYDWSINLHHSQTTVRLQLIEGSFSDEYFTNYNTSNICQSEFRPNHITETTLIRVTYNIWMDGHWSAKHTTHFVRFWKDFYCVNYNLHLVKLRVIEFSAGALWCVGLYLAVRRLCACWGNYISWNL